jgi:hypothetical protein
MTAEQDRTPEPKERVELEPLVTRATPLRHVERSQASATHPPGEVGSPVPATPLHECPQCGYNLTGLTSRRCPECGEPFTLSEARRQGSLSSPRTKRDMGVARANRLGLRVGIALQLAGVIVPVIVLANGGRRGQLFFVGIGLSILTIACLVKGYFEMTWSDAMLAAGLVSATLATMLVALA